MDYSKTGLSIDFSIGFYLIYSNILTAAGTFYLKHFCLVSLIVDRFAVFASDETRISRWYFGGLAAAGASCITHPLDLLKVALQTQNEGHLPVLKLAWQIIKEEGVLALYNGLSASVLRQLTYSTVRFAIYDLSKQALGNKIGLGMKILLASAAGAIGGFIGTPADMVNVRMQNDMKMPKELRRKLVNKHLLTVYIYILLIGYYL